MLSGNSSGYIDLSPGDAAQLNECRRIYDEPAPFIVWGLLLIIIGMALVIWHIYWPLVVLFLLTLGTMLVRMKTLHSILRRALLSRATP